jgi:hypothetical protein
MTGLLSGALAGLACDNTPGLAGPLDRIFERCGHTSEDVRIGKPTPARTFVRNREIEKSLVPLARTAPSPASPFTGSGTSRQARSWFDVGSDPPQPQTTISNSKDVTRILRSCVCQPGALIGVGRTPPTRRARTRATLGLKAGARRAIGSLLSRNWEDPAAEPAACGLIIDPLGSSDAPSGG